MGGLDLQADAMKALVNRLSIRKEKLYHTLFTTTGNWDNTTATSNRWDDTTNGTPLADIDAEVRTLHTASGMGPDTMAINLQTFQALRSHPDFTNLAGVTGVATAPPRISFGELKKIMAEMFGIKEVYVSKGVTNGAAAGLTYSGAFIWSTDNAWLGYTGVDQEVGMSSNVAAKTFGTQDWVARSYEDPQTKSTIAELSTICHAAVVNSAAGVTITNVLA